MPTLDNVPSGSNVQIGVKGADGFVPTPAVNMTSGTVIESNAPITSSNPNNIINWRDFSAAQNEIINFADSNNYMNIVTGGAQSFIDGTINSGADGNRGDIYVINPNVILFGKNAQINVGNLYASTRGVDETAKTAFDVV